MEVQSLFGGVLRYLQLVLALSLRQFIFLFAVLFLLGYLIHVINKNLLKHSWRLFGAKAYLWIFGWFSIPIHELGHAAFALIFGHKIQRIVLFDPQAKSGSHGFVQHSWNHKNLWHQAGNLFVGVGPIILGSLVIWLLSGLLLELNLEGVESFSARAGLVQQLRQIPQFLHSSLMNTISILRGIFDNFGFKTALFLFLSFGISTNINLSDMDISHIKPALIVIIRAILIFNLATAWLGDFSLNALSWLESGLTGFYGILVYVMVMNLGFLLVLRLFSLLFK